MMQGRALCVLWLSLAAAGGLWAQDDAKEQARSSADCPSEAHADEKHVEGTHG